MILFPPGLKEKLNNNIMAGFLDHKLFDHVTNREIDNAKDFNAMINELYRICEDHWKPQADIKMGPVLFKILINKAFKSWDMCVAKLKTVKGYRATAELMENYSYKKIFMGNKELKEAFDKM